MRIAIVGAGGVGGGFGAALAKAGADVTFIARGAHLAAMKSQGLKVQGPRRRHPSGADPGDRCPADVGKVDFVLFCVKQWDVESAGAHIKPMIGPDTAVIPLQNGVDAAERLIPILGINAVMGGVAQISAAIAGPGLIQQVGTFMRMIFGELDGRRSPRGEKFLALCLQAGFDATLSEADPDRTLDEVHPARDQRQHRGAGAPTGWQTARRPGHSPDVHFGCREVMEVGRARGVALPANAIETVLALTDHLPVAQRPSMALDLERGNRLELPWLSGKVVDARQGTRRADADAQPDVCDAEALRDGEAGLEGAARQRPV